MPAARALPRLFVAALSLATLAACGGGGGGDPVSPGLLGDGTLQATVDGVVWTMPASAAFAIADAAGNFSIAGSNTATPTREITLLLFGIDAPGTYPLGVTMVRGGALSIDETKTTRSWTNPLSGAAGTVTVTSVTPTRIAGTFSATVQADSSATTPATRTVTAGKFDLPIIGPATRVVPANFGGTVTGSINGVAYTPSELLAIKATTGVGSDTGMVITTGNNAWEVTISVPKLTGVGSYPIALTSLNTVTVSTTKAPASTWSTLGTSTTGTISITAVTASRIKGSISLSLPPAGGAAKTAIPVTLTFDAGIH